MKTLHVVMAVLMVLGLLAATFSIARAVPPLPSSYWGTAKNDGDNVPVGALITAWINGVQYAQTSTMIYQGTTVYALDVPGDDPATTEIEGGVSGDPVEFRINGLPATQTGTWQSGSNIEINLTVSGVLLVHTYMPMVFGTP